MPGRLMAGHLVLVQYVGVRVLPGQQHSMGVKVKSSSFYVILNISVLAN